jgi:hypothetical protein
LVNVGIQEAITAFYDEHAMPAKEVAWRLARIARADMGDYTDVTKPADLKDVDSYPVKKIETTGRRLADGSVTVKMRLELHSQLQALEDIGKVHGLFDRGSEDKPLTVNNINYSVDEWQQEQQRRRAEVTKTLEIFDDETTD